MDAFVISVAMTVAVEANLEGQLLAFPPREVVDEQIEFAKRYYRFLRDNENMAKGKSDVYLWIIDQQTYIRRACKPWGELMRAQSKLETLSRRMQALESVKLLLLDTQGQMPPLVAYWGFREGPPPPPSPKYTPSPCPKAG
jgi:hypothetical protein